MPYTKDSYMSAHGVGLINRIDERIKAFYELAGDDPVESVLELAARVISKDFAVFIKPFNCDLSFEDPNNYYTEREWRLLGSVEIMPKSVKRIVVAAGYKDRLLKDLPEFAGYEIYELPE